MPGLQTAFAQGLAANRPAASSSNAGFYWFSTDTQILYQSTGSAWTQIAASSAADALTTKADLLSRSASGYSRLGVGTDGYVLTADSTQTTGLKWAASGGLTNPMTTAGDLITGGTAGAPARLGLGASGQVLTVSGGAVAWGAAGGSSGGALTQLAQTVLGAAQATFDFTSIASSYSALRLDLLGRGDNASTTVSLRLRLNNDSAANYDYVQLYGVGNAAGSGTTLGATSMQFGNIPAATAQSGSAACYRIDLLSYAGTTFHKVAFCDAYYDDAASPSPIRLASGGRWHSTSAVTRVTLLLSAGNFATGSVCTLYGLS